MTDLFLLFIIYGFLGWIVEVLYVGFNSGKFYNRGFLHMTFLPIYAFGAIAITVSLQNLPNPLLVYILGVIVTTVLEYATSYIMEKMFHTRWWDYSTYKYNIKGRVCLKNSLLFGVLSLVVIYGLNPLFDTYIALLDESLKVGIVNVFLGVLIFDLAYTLQGISKLPIRDIRIISGKVKAYRDGKLRDLEELILELEGLDDKFRSKFKEEIEEFRVQNTKIRTEFKDYTGKVGTKLDINPTLISGFIIILVIGFLVNNVFLLELIGIAIVIIAFIIIFKRNRRN
ncbi:putative ABC transporter permease [Mollicutes bacterium LVI A0039]|nr:putative ABC transporter permease [Mollicutes bacterium LVI A0039]